ncbi:MAG: YhcH/YjgK/YiaL family protein [Odoribacter sp.]|nr:YhcH/YjgK/YiaL family protein [Odoribacter sp.]
MVLTSILGLLGCSGKRDPSTWDSERTDNWFEKGEWHKGWTVTPDNSINRTYLAKAWYKNSERWSKAFAFLKDNDLAKLELKRYELDGDNLFVLVSEYNTKNPEDTKFEAHRKYIDIQYVATGCELIGISPLTSQDSVLQEYNATKDIEFLSVKESKMVKATPANFFVFFPEDAHMPGLREENLVKVRKIVIKILID